MENKKYDLTSRNNYFLGKLMTARDFFAEQNYFNSKRRLTNKLIFSPGIVAGLSVFLVDDKTFSLESGVAIDYDGFEIVVPESYSMKLDLVNGFDKFRNSNCVYLCIKYKEKFDETTFSITSQSTNSDEKQFNRIKETYELFLTDKEPNSLSLKIDGLMYQNIELFNKDGIKIWGVFPKYVNFGKKAKVSIFLDKNRPGEAIYFKTKIKGIMFKDVGEIEYEETENSDQKSISRECYLTCNANSETASEFTISKDDFILEAGTKKFNLDEDIIVNLVVKEKPLKDIIISEYYSLNFNDILEKTDDKYIYLAKINIISNDVGYIIEKLEKVPANQYLLNRELLRLIQDIELEDLKNNLGISKTSVSEKSTTKPENIKKVEKLIEKDNIVTGIETINLGFRPKQNKVYYSYEFVHGLGPGNVAIVTAIVNEENSDIKEPGALIFGDRSIFKINEAKLSAPDVEIASLVNTSKGTLRLGVRLEEKTNVQFVKVRWWAFKPLETNKLRDNLVITDDLKVIVSPDSVTVKPLGQVRFSAKIVGTEDQKISWALGKDNPGKIDSNGLFTAPAKEGIYEIQARSVSFEKLYATAYVVVTIDQINNR